MRFKLVTSVFAMKLFSIEGPIGIGKSTLLSELKKNGYPIYPEPIEEWAPVLKAFYHDRSKTAVDCQRFIYSSLIKRHLRIWKDNYEVNVMERSLKASLDVFTTATKRTSPSSNWGIVEKYGEGGMARYESQQMRAWFRFLRMLYPRDITFLGLNCVLFKMR